MAMQLTQTHAYDGNEKKQLPKNSRRYSAENRGLSYSKMFKEVLKNRNVFGTDSSDEPLRTPAASRFRIPHLSIRY